MHISLSESRIYVLLRIGEAGASSQPDWHLDEESLEKGASRLWA